MEHDGRPEDAGRIAAGGAGAPPEGPGRPGDSGVPGDAGGPGRAPLTGRQRVKKWVLFSLRWGIAIVGIWLVLRQVSLYDRVWVIENDQLISERLWQNVPRDAEKLPEYRVYDPAKKEGRVVPRDRTANKPEKKEVEIKVPGGGTTRARLVGVDLVGDLDKKPSLSRVYVVYKGAGEEKERGRWVPAGQLAERYWIKVPYPRVDVGIARMVRGADWVLLVLSVVVFPVTFIVTTFRWKKLLAALDIHLTATRAFVLNMVGAFYNTFMLGSTGGDLLKAYYASKQTKHRTRAVMSVFVDRVIGLLALLVMGGAMAGYQYLSGGPDDPAASACGKIAVVSALAVVGAGVGFLLLGDPKIRNAIGLDWVLARLPKQKQVKNAVLTMELYGRQKALVLLTLVMTFPVHITVVLSAMLAGKALGLTLAPLYYFVAVPVIVLVGSIPISPQGAGVMEYFAILLVGRQGGTVAQAFALTMSIRLVQMLWNLTGGVFVFRGGYHQPTAAEAREMEVDEVAEVKAA